MNRLSHEVLVTLPFELTEEDRRAIADARGGTADARRLMVDSQEELDAIDGSGVGVLVSELVPQDLRRWPDLRFVQLAAAGINHVPPDHAIWRSGIPVATASGIHSVPMAQFAIGMLLAMTHQFHALSEFGRTRQWPNRDGLAGRSLRGLTASVIGYGSIGRECGRLLAGLGMRVMAVKRDISRRDDPGYVAWPGTGDPDGRIPERWFSFEQLSEVLPLCDVHIVATPRTKLTRGSIDDAALAMMKPSALLIVISRGGIVVEDALARVLTNHVIAGAAVDCFVKEPLAADHPLFAAPNCILTPHMSGVYDNYAAELYKLLCENLRRLAANRPLLNLARGDQEY